MTIEASQLLAEALKRVGMNESFCPTQLGARIGLKKPQAEVAARALSNAGVLSLGFESAAVFTVEYRKSHAAAAKVEEKLARKKKKK
jgi:hypothetical protein